tara:strand:+ start:399 stop:848 length:450 start_codon:yes stop_codon:yes gene_type:complete
MQCKHETEEALLNNRVRTLIGNQSVTEFARVLGLNHESVRRYIRRKTSPPAVFLLRIAERMEVDGTWLLTGISSDDRMNLRNVHTSLLIEEINRRSEVFLEIVRQMNPEKAMDISRSALVCAALDLQPSVTNAAQQRSSLDAHEKTRAG